MANMMHSFHGGQSKPQLDYSKYTADQLAAMNATGVIKKNSLFNITFTKDLSSYPDYNFSYLTTLYFAYADHHQLPYPGTISEQPNKIIEVFNLFKAIIFELNEQERKKQDKRK